MTECSPIGLARESLFNFQRLRSLKRIYQTPVAGILDSDEASPNLLFGRFNIHHEFGETLTLSCAIERRIHLTYA